MKKKGIITLIIIWLFALTTIILLSDKKKIEEEEKEKEEQSYEPKIESLEKYQYINYTDLYDDNDLKIERVIPDYNTGNYMVISGLKNKDIENKINDRIYQIYTEMINNGYHITFFEGVNAFNILSLRYSLSRDNEYDYEYHGINYDLTTGEEIKVSDILNTQNLEQIVYKEYFNSMSFWIESRIRYAEMPYNEEDKNREQINEYKNRLSTLEDESIKFARNFDMNNYEFYINSKGIVFLNISDMKDLPIETRNNPRLFNFYYKYKTDESIFDGSFSGAKNKVLTDISLNVECQKIDDYVYSRRNYYIENQNNDIEKSILEKYINRLDKNKFTLITNTFYNSYLESKELQISECVVDKSEKDKYMKLFADAVEKPSMNGGVYINDSACYGKAIYEYNENVETNIQKENGNNYIEVNIVNNKQKGEEITNAIKEEINTLLQEYDFIYPQVKKVNEDVIEIEYNCIKEKPTYSSTNKTLIYSLK